jgi:hypothetical protein
MMCTFTALLLAGIKDYIFIKKYEIIEGQE